VSAIFTSCNKVAPGLEATNLLLLLPLTASEFRQNLEQSFDRFFDDFLIIFWQFFDNFDKFETPFWKIRQFLLLSFNKFKKDKKTKKNPQKKPSKYANKETK
jgi:hypothetical protein